jgi:cobalt-zinc-cadmium efflux system outer membrane protein
MKRLSARILGVATVLMGLFIASSASADEATTAAVNPTFTEEQLFDRWLKNSAEVAAWKTQIAAARWDVLTAKVLPNPSVQLTVNQLLDGKPPDAKTGYQAQLTWPLPIFGQIGARRAAAEARVTVAETQAIAQLWQRAADMQSAMVDTAFADARVVMLERNLAELDRLQGIITKRASVGSNSTYDVLRVTTSATTVRAALTTAQTDRAEAESRLLALMAEPTLGRVHVTRAGLATFRGPLDEQALVKAALERRPDLELARKSALASTRIAQSQRKDAIPTPSLVAGGLLVTGPYGLQVTGGLSVPLPFFDRNQGQIGRSLADAQTSELMAKALESRIKNEVEGSWRARETARAALEQYRTASLPAAAELLSRAEVTYQAGTFSIAELFDAYRTTWDARLQELQLEEQMAEAEIALERAAVLIPLAPMK